MQRKHVLGSSLVRLSIWKASETCDPKQIVSSWIAADVRTLLAQTHSTTLHGDSSLLLILPRIQVSDLSCQTRRDDIVRGQQRVDERRLSMVDVSEHRHVLQPPSDGLWIRSYVSAEADSSRGLPGCSRWVRQRS
jgi:hypothetical protein